MRELIDRLRENKIHISLENKNLKLKFDDELIPSSILEEIKKNKGQIIEFLKNNIKSNNIYTPIPKSAEAVSYPLAASQGRLWILSQLEGGSLAYNMPAAVRLTGVVDVNKFEESFRRLIDRHEILRTCVKTNEEGDIRQYIIPRKQVNFKIAKEDYSSVENQEEAIASYLQEKNSEPFDLEQAPLVRASLIKLQKEEYVFFLSLHHIIGDGWSIGLLISEVVKTYNALIQGKKINLADLRIQYKDYAVWLNTAIQQEKQQASEQYWLQQFEGELPVLDLPSFKIRPLIQTYTGDNITHHFSKLFLEKVKTFSKEQDVTLFMTLMAGINTLLHRYTGQYDIIIGTPIAGRDHPDLENQLGLYLNTLAIRTQFKEGNSFLDLVAAQKETLLGAYEHQSYSFDALVGKLNLKRDASRSVLFDVLVVLQNHGHLNNLNNEELISLEVSDYNFKSKTSKFDISFAFAETEGLDLTIEYNTDIYDGYLIERMFTHFEHLIIESLEHPEALIQEVDYLTKEEKHQLLVDFNDTDVAYPKDKTIVDLFEEQVLRTPNNVAVLFEETELTYQELNEKANQLANYLRETYTIEPDDLVGIKLDRSDVFIISLIGILKSGAAYVPIDKNYPSARKEYLKKNSNYRLVVNEEEYHKFINHRKIYPTLNIDKINDSRNLAYVIYTSGSTGLAKGIMMEHQSLKNLIVFHNDQFSVGEVRNVLQFTSISFDVSFQEIFSTLTIGATLFPISETQKKDIDEIGNFIKNNKIETVFLPTAYFKMLIENRSFLDIINKCLKNIIVAGEQLILNQDVIDIIKFSEFKLHNHYGPAETHVVSTCVLKKESNIISKIPHIGSPISNTQIYILDELLEPLPIGVLGKLYISGTGVARGYLNNPELTAEKFIANPFIEGSRMYDTGDLGRWLPDGNIEFMGRKDYQVKIRGFRIELGEIENAISQYSEELKQVIVEFKEVNKEKALVAFFTSRVKIDKSELRHFLEGKLPDYMVPSFYIELEELLLTPNGKIDRKALPSVAGEDLIRKEYLAPRNKIEESLVAIWQEVLAIEKIGITDNFFELGGHSLLATRLVSAIQKQGYSISLQDVFNADTLGDLAIQLDSCVLSFEEKLNALINENDGILSGRMIKGASHSDVLKERNDYYENYVDRSFEKNMKVSNNYNHILLLGTTGYLGIHLLHDLLQNGGQQITIIIRPEKYQSANERMEAMYQYYFEQSLSSHLNQLHILEGDITDERFGLTEEIYLTLQNKVDAILNSAAYTKHYGNQTIFDKVNVGLIQHMIDFVQNQSCKAAIHHVSTMGIIGVPGDNKKDIFTELDIDKGQLLSTTYQVSKLTAEKMLDEARANGLTVSIYRVGNLTFHSKTGKFQANPQDNAFYTILKAFIEIGVMPKLDSGFDISCIDWISETIITMMDKKELLNLNWQIQDPAKLSNELFAQTANKYGFGIKVINYIDFLKFIRDNYSRFEEAIDNVVLHTGILNGQKSMETFYVRNDLTNLVMQMLELVWDNPNEFSVSNMIGHATQSGFFKKNLP
ncbi:non-ribosomal peptide synthetase [Flavobacterium yafengii]|uniref:non-ribosomal peptide synthetase n=1 Tax=Flavobacterium yafengii TaxID=3041253 RepID=UPI0024A819F8|nr:non-ribosomal peptide synthetase [Flavobacterium yafengii]MDI5888436.1 amino acid adenylation domain-containing protein [Flavobacterium yafengii]